ncbi:MAG: hypothetical protein HY865_09405 [Chloroflexi bacterium]|nr:hypothetical protein [Chloroflexota bacterium]
MTMKKVYFVSANLDKYPLSIEGELHYQSNIQNVAMYIDDDKKSFREDSFTAELFFEDENPHDPGNAIRVEIDGETVGYLADYRAKKYRKALQKIGITEPVIGCCGAAIFGKREDEYEDMNFGVWLDLDLKDLKVEPERVKPVQQPANPEPITQPQKAVLPQPAQPVKQKKQVKFGGKMPLLPMNGKGWAYWLIIFPFVAVINLYILLFVGIWYVVKWLWEIIISIIEK